MKVGSLFAGIGGFDEGLRQAGMETTWQVEKEPFCLKVLKTRFPLAVRAMDILTCRGLISSVPESHAKMSLSQVSVRDSLAHVQDSFTSLRDSCKSFDPLGSCSRMFPDFSVLTTEETLQKSSAFSWSNAGMGFAGVSLTANFSESPNVAAVCLLSDVLESHAPQRFFLSPKAASGILRRAVTRGRDLPIQLRTALEELAVMDAKEPILQSAELLKEGKAAGGYLTQKNPPKDNLSTFRKSALDSQVEIVKGQDATSQNLHSYAEQSEQISEDQTKKKHLTDNLSVRRLTPTECETLQGFPKGWTLPDTALLETPLPCQSSSGSGRE
jgi:site-specific DNA-cytosine methylase